MKTAAWLVAGTAALFSAAGLAEDRFRGVGARTGGDTTRNVTNQTAFTLPAANLAAERQRDFFFGNRVFNTNWVIAPSSTASFDGLGPTFNRVSCSGCHLRDGRGHPPTEPGGEMLSMLVRLSVPGKDATGGPKPHPVYGDQLNDRAIPGVPVEGRAVLAWTEKPGKYGDGEPYSLRAPQIAIKDLGYGPLGSGVMFSPRVAPQMIGLGLLEAVPDGDVLALADPEDADGDGISGRANRVWDATAARTALGRFGWKANVPSLLQQNAGAARGDIGLTTSLFPDQSCPAAQAACRRAPTGGTPELSDEFLRKLTLYTRTLAVPARRNIEDPAVQRGERLFSAIGCAACHRPTVQTGAAELPELAHQTFHPFTDLLLHDMGPGLADGRPDFEADGNEWRTAPLWGLGLIETVNKHDFLLHDGRARGPAEAILWHGGEAERAKEAFRTLPREEREAVLAFLRSL